MFKIRVCGSVANVSR